MMDFAVGDITVNYHRKNLLSLAVIRLGLVSRYRVRFRVAV